MCHGAHLYLLLRGCDVQQTPGEMLEAFLVSFCSLQRREGLSVRSKDGQRASKHKGNIVTHLSIALKTAI